MALIKSNGYNVVIGKKSLSAISKFLKQGSYSSYFILCDENTMQHCLPILVAACPSLNSAQIIEIESGETNKSIEISANIWLTLIENKTDKNTLILNLGGGVVSDLGGFCASVYKRGIDFINVPTSLLAMADASVGGKTGIDFYSLKNVIGTFAQPKAVFINPDFLNSLNKRHLLNGLVEIYKIVIVGDAAFFKELNGEIQKENFEDLVTKSISLKNKIVLKDPFDKGVRKILNFGHTIGHAIEALFLNEGVDILHGEAVAIGMVIETHIAFQKKLISKVDYTKINTLLKTSFELKSILNLSVETILETIKNDKKTSKNKFLFALPTKIGACKFDAEVSETQIKKAISYYNALVK